MAMKRNKVIAKINDYVKEYMRITGESPRLPDDYWEMMHRILGDASADVDRPGRVLEYDGCDYHFITKAGIWDDELFDIMHVIVDKVRPYEGIGPCRS